MSLTTHSRFFFGYEITSANSSLDFDEGAAELQATLNVGSFTFTEFAVEIKRAMDDVGGQAYIVTANRSTRTITISASGNFALLLTSGTRTGSSIYGDAGFTGADLTGTNTYEGNNTAGDGYTTQFILQDHIASEDFEESVSESINESASGNLEVVTFGDRNFVQMNFKFLTDKSQPGSVIRNRPTGIADFRVLIKFMRTKQPFEFMPDEDIVATFQKVLLETSPQSSKGTGFKLRELFDRGLPGHFDSGILKLRVIT